jgi:large subunit ribosomal protein L10
MLREKKTQIINQLAESLSRSTVIIATNYQGFTAKQMTELRHALADATIDYRVIKNTLAHFAAQRAGREKVMSIIEGPTALAFGYDDAVKLAKVLDQYTKSTGLNLQIKGGLLGERVLSADEVAALASLPPKEVLIAQLIAGLQSPIRSLHNILNSPLQGLLNVLQNRIQKFNQ